MHTLCHSLLRGEPPPPRSTTWGAYRSTISCEAVPLHSDMKLVMFGIDYQKNLIIQFPVFVQLYTQTKLTMYQVEMVPVPILDASNKIQSYTQLKIEKPYIALNDETYISIHSQEPNNCKRIGYECFCEELFVVKSKHKYSCASAVYFNSNMILKKIVIFIIITISLMQHHLY